MVPEKYWNGQPIPLIISASKKLKDIVGSGSWKILRVARYLKENVEQWLIWQGKEEFDEFNKMKNSTESTTLRKKKYSAHTQKKAEDMKQSVLHVARDNRGKISSHP